MIRMYMRKFDMDEPHLLEESLDDGVDRGPKAVKNDKGDEIQLDEKYYK